MTLPTVPHVPTLTSNQISVITELGNSGSFLPPVNGKISETNAKIGELRTLLTTIESAPVGTDLRLDSGQITTIRANLDSLESSGTATLDFQASLIPEGGTTRDIMQTMTTVNSGMVIANEVNSSLNACTTTVSAFGPLLAQGTQLFEEGRSQVDTLITELNNLTLTTPIDTTTLNTINNAVTSATSSVTSGVSSATAAVAESIEMLHRYADTILLDTLSKDPCMQTVVDQCASAQVKTLLGL
ncbi:hypothetical protein GR7B_00145 [Vibrio phage vB_VcorM_GR7B]|nr:hypothetical protein GR7B_00145 [Vibrio phage vB_VcorM_GR7B]